MSPPEHFVGSPYLVPFDHSFKIKNAETDPPKSAPTKEECQSRLKEVISEIKELQKKLLAQNSYSVLLVFQALDAAGKDSAVEAITTGLGATGFQVHSFKGPSHEELDHDFLWRTTKALPERGRIGIFIRSQYEEVLIVRVHPEYLEAQRLPHQPKLEQLWEQRLESISNQERHLAYNGTVVIKFFLHVSKKEQNERFLARLEEPDKNWKFSAQDLKEQEYRAQYLEAFEEALRYTSTPWAPWYAIPADKKAYTRLTIAEIVRDTLTSLDLSYPEISSDKRAELAQIRKELVAKLRNS